MRQEEHYHKCHRCIYRGKPADYQLPEQIGGAVVMLPRPEDRGMPNDEAGRVLSISDEGDPVLEDPVPIPPKKPIGKKGRVMEGGAGTR